MQPTLRATTPCPRQSAPPKCTSLQRTLRSRQPTLHCNLRGLCLRWRAHTRPDNRLRCFPDCVASPRAAPESTRFVPKQSIFRKWFGSRSDDSVTQTLVIEDVVDPTPVARPVTRHTTGYRGLSASTSTRFEPVYIEPVLVQPTIDTQVSRPVESQVRTFKGASRSGRRHLFGELFGY